MKETVLTGVFWDAGFYLALSALVIPVLRFFKIPVSLGYLLAGIALGPYAVGSLTGSFPALNILSLDNTENVKILAELGIVLLLFVIGLEISPRRLWQMRGMVFGLGGLQVIITANVIGGIAFLWGNAVQVALLLGLGLALSSTAIVTQWLHQQKLFGSDVGRSSFSILLLQDLAVIPILLLLTILSTTIEGDISTYIFLSVLKMVVTVVAIYVIGKIILRPLFVFTNKHGGAEVFMAISLLTIVVSASIASYAGLSMGLGAFIAGLLLADTEYRHEISSLVVPFKSMLLGSFFLSFGMSINLQFIAEKPFWLFASVLGLMSIKACIVFALCKLWKQTTSVSAETAILLSQAGEFGLLVVGGALTAGLMQESVGQFMLIVIGMTMMVTPVIAPFARKAGKFIEHRGHDGKDYHADNAKKVEGHIVIFGYGRIGNLISENLSREGFKSIGFDKNIERVNKARAKSCPVYYGDTTKQATLEAASLSTALAVVITLDEALATKNLVKLIRKFDAEIPIIARAHDQEIMKEFNALENLESVAENVILGDILSEKTLEYCRPYRKTNTVEPAKN